MYGIKFLWDSQMPSAAAVNTIRTRMETALQTGICMALYLMEFLWYHKKKTIVGGSIMEIRFASAMKLQYVKFSRWSNYTYFPKDFKIEAYTGAGWKTLVDMQDYENACNLFSFTET